MAVRGACSVLLAGALGVLVPVPAHGKKGGKPLPYRVAVSVAYDAAGAGPERFREQIERRLTDALDRAGCVAKAAAEGDVDTDLELRLILNVVEDEMRYDESIAARAEGPDFGDAERVTARLEVDVIEELRKPPDTLFSHDYVLVEQRRPLVPGEDASVSVKNEAIREIVRRGRTFLCKQTEKAIEKRLGKAR